MKERFEPITNRCGDIIEWFMASPDIPDNMELQFKIRLAVEEAVANVVDYAYEGGQGWLEAETITSADGSVLSLVIRDAGVPFNPLEKEDPNLSLSVEERGVGGLGIFLCKQLMDSVGYVYQDGCNVLTMTKTVGASAKPSPEVEG
ncbi:MAG: ATP-binding protein [Bacteroidales bacterium]|nr:ATP-binding protein [Bacteroidales bacterium]